MTVGFKAFRDIPALELRRIKKWVYRESAPPKCPSEMSDDEIADVLQVLVEQEGGLFDGKTIWIYEAICRLRKLRA